MENNKFEFKYNQAKGGTKEYYLIYIADFKQRVIVEKGTFEGISDFETEFPDNEIEMKNFIKAFETLYPCNNHEFEKYISLLRGTNLLRDNRDIFDNDVFIEIIDYIRLDAFEELESQIESYPLIQSSSDFISYIEKFKEEVIIKEDPSLGNFVADFPYNEKDLESFIKAFEILYPMNNHNFSRYVPLVKGLTLINEDTELQNTDMSHEIEDFIRENLLQDLKQQIVTYPHIEIPKAFDYKGYIEELNEKLGFDGMNSEIIHEGTGENEQYDILIEGNNFTTLQIIIENQDLDKHLKNQDLEMFILKHYESAIVDFNVDDLFNELYSAVSSQYRPSQFFNMLEEDKMFFTNTLRDAIQLIK
ncbi:hypothetical protein [Mammaliicoccus vitulinus]|uniref:hypothetical protein n=1 Tax=Mammaliicoccus vitulinus TaxID=71237 RepID=UPI00248B9F12|nr:hypothetical protein [Mammaliicoccus vitulinus]